MLLETWSVTLPESDCAEICNGVDDNFNGEADENIPPGDSCSAGLGACIRQVECSVLMAVRLKRVWNAMRFRGLGQRLCNGVTDDCDERVDENVRRSDSPVTQGQVTSVDQVRTFAMVGADVYSQHPARRPG